MFSQTFKRLIAQAAMTVVMFAQLAVAAYACPTLDGPAGVIAAIPFADPFGGKYYLDEEGVVFLRRVFLPIHRREIPLAEIKEFATYSRVTDSEHGKRAYGLETRTLGQPLQFGEGLDVPVELHGGVVQGAGQVFGEHGGVHKVGQFADLNITPMVDMFTIIVIFLLQNFSATGEILCLPCRAAEEEAD